MTGMFLFKWQDLFQTQWVLSPTEQRGTAQQPGSAVPPESWWLVTQAPEALEQSALLDSEA